MAKLVIDLSIYILFGKNKSVGEIIGWDHSVGEG